MWKVKKKQERIYVWIFICIYCKQEWDIMSLEPWSNWTYGSTYLTQSGITTVQARYFLNIISHAYQGIHTH